MFVDDGDDEDNSSDEDNFDNVEDEGGVSSLVWNRGLWWRGVVGGCSLSRR